MKYRPNKFLPLREELPPDPPAPPTTSAMAESIVIGAFITGVNDAGRHGYWRHLTEDRVFA